MQTIQFMQEGHERRFDLLWRRLKPKQREDAAMVSMLYLATGQPQVLERFSAEPYPSPALEAIIHLIVQLYNGRTTITIIELIERLDEQQMSLVLEAIKLRAYGCQMLQKGAKT